MSIAGRSTRKVAIVGGVRIPFCKMGTHYLGQRMVDLMAAALKGLVHKYDLQGKKVDDVALGAVFEHPAVWNSAREAVLHSGLSPESPAIGHQRACATSLDTTISIANKIALGQIEVGIAGGAEAMSDPALFFDQKLSRTFLKILGAKTSLEKLKLISRIRPQYFKPKTPPGYEMSTKKSMGVHCEEMVKEWKVTRQEQDELAFESHKRAAQAYQDGFYNDLLVPHLGVEKDQMVRPDTKLDKLAKLKTVFDTSEFGTLTAGNSSPFTDGASCILLASKEWAEKNGLPVLAYLSEYETTAIDLFKEGLLMAPAYAVPKMLARANLRFSDIDFFDIHEAFAGQVLCTLKAWESAEFCQNKLHLQNPMGSIPREKLNVKGGSVALGHPFGATGTRIVATMAKALDEKGQGRALISICAGGGMGTVALLEKNDS